MPYAGQALPTALTAAPARPVPVPVSVPVSAGPPVPAPAGAWRHSPPAIPARATLAANEAIAARRRRGQAVLPLAFGEAGLPVHPSLRAAPSEATARDPDGPVPGLA